MNEFEIIEKFFKRQTPDASNPSVGIGDDAAVISVPDGYDLVLAMDTLVESVHFQVTTAAMDIGWKALAVNLSDLAAMGAEPRWVTLSLTLPSVDADWLGDFSGGFFELADQYGVSLVGGDLTRGPLSITVQAQGLLPAGQAMTRSGASIGDLIYVSGSLGDAGYALLDDCESDYCRQRLNRPQPRLELGQALLGLASSAIDISDGLAGDLRHILDASGCGARLDSDRLPISSSLEAKVDAETARRLALTAGDDYELCFTVAPDRVAQVERLSRDLAIQLTAIGVIERGDSLNWGHEDQVWQYSAFQHF